MHESDGILDIVIDLNKYIINFLFGPHKNLQWGIDIRHVDTDGPIVKRCDVVGPVASHHRYRTVNIRSHTGRKARLMLGEPFGENANNIVTLPLLSFKYNMQGTTATKNNRRKHVQLK